MRLIDEIIELLSREQPNVETALTKTKVLLYRIGEPQLAAWVTAEINGYAANNDIPTYRIIPTRVLATVTDGMTVRRNSIPIPINHLPDAMKEGLRNTKVGHGVATLETFIAATEDTLSKPLSPEFYGLLAKGLQEGFFIETAHVEIARSQVVGILAQIRSRLLDFVLQLSSRMPSDLPEADAKARSKQIDAAGLFQSAIFGDNATIIVGNHNNQTASHVSVRVGDFESLAAFLRGNKVDEADLSTLKTAIHADGPRAEDPARQFGPKVRAWMANMLKKAVETSWQIELGVASSVLATAIGRYYGWP